MRLYYMLETIDPIIMSSANATTNNHDSLEYIAGSTVLGLLASRCYQKPLADEQFWSLFHNGDCRFSNAYPLANIDGIEQFSLPTPASWFGEKNTDMLAAGRYCANTVQHHGAIDFKADATRQYRQCRGGFVNARGYQAKVKKNVIGKTAIDNQTGIAAQSQLFNYAYIEAGQRFAGWIDCQDEALLNEIQQQFTIGQSQHFRIGRSRNAEFGRVNITPLAVTTPAVELLSYPNELVLWCLSDCELFNSQGMPTLSPTGEDIHPQLQASLNLKRSFIRVERANRFNQKRQGEDSEQLLVAMGSVLVFDLSQPIDSSLLTALHQQGIGANRQQGLGWVYVNPPWANHANIGHVYSNNDELFVLPQLPSQAKPITPAMPASSSLLLDWVQAQVSATEQRKQHQQAVNEMVRKVIDCYLQARRYHNIGVKIVVGPSSSQWQRLFELVKQPDTNWQQTAFMGDHAICKANNDSLGWGIDWHDDSKPLTFATAMQTLFEQQSNVFMRLLLEQLCVYDLSTWQGLQRLKAEYGEGD